MVWLYVIIIWVPFVIDNYTNLPALFWIVFYIFISIFMGSVVVFVASGPVKAIVVDWLLDF